MKETIRRELISQYGTDGIEAKLKRFLALKPSSLSIVDEHTYLIRDITNAYVSGSFYPALTGACCLGERIFNVIIKKLAKYFKKTKWYKEIYDKDSIIDWEKAIEILFDWKVIDNDLKNDYLRLKDLRHTSVHYQNREQDAESMSYEAITIINKIIGKLFGIDPSRRDVLLYFDVPREIFIRKDAEQNPMIKAFYIPCATYVGPSYKIEQVSNGRHKLIDIKYEDKDITDDEFVNLRNNYVGKVNK